MAYSSVADLKRRLEIDLDETRHDQKLRDCIEWADTLIAGAVAAVEGAVPATTPDALKYASEDLACFAWYRNLNPTQATLFRDTGMLLLNNWIKTNYGISESKTAGAEE